MRKHFVYIHKKRGSDEVFYVGAAIHSKYKNIYHRATCKQSKPKEWFNIVNSIGYDIEIIYDNLSFDQAEEIEIKMIGKFKRKVDGGTLTNMSTGGRYAHTGHKLTEETKKIIGSYHKGKKLSESHISILKTKSLGKPLPEYVRKKISERHLLNRKTGKNILNNITGIYYGSIAEAAKSEGIGYSALKAKLSGQNKNNTSLVYA